MLSWILPSPFKVGSMLLLILVFVAASVFLGEIPLVLGYVLIPISVFTRAVQINTGVAQHPQLPVHGLNKR